MQGLVSQGGNETALYKSPQEETYTEQVVEEEVEGIMDVGEDREGKGPEPREITALCLM